MRLVCFAPRAPARRRPHVRTLAFLLSTLSTLAACAAGEAPEDTAHDTAPDAVQMATAPAAGFAVGTARLQLPDQGGRPLPVQLWYPADEAARAEAAAGHPVPDFETDPARRARLASLLDAAPAGCPSRTMHAAIGAAPHTQDAPFPLVVFSHHHTGTRFSLFTIAEALARAGIVVAAPDHVGDTLFEYTGQTADALAGFTPAALRQRATDVSRVIDLLLDPAAAQVPEALRGRIDPARIGALGHSLGGLTTGLVGVQEPRVKAAAYLAISPASFLQSLVLQTPAARTFRVPGLYLAAQEDIIQALVGGISVIRGNFRNQTPAAWMVEVRDTGHFSFADDLALVPLLGNGCGRESRVSRLFSTYTNLESARARGIAASYVAAFFSHQLLGASATPLNRATPRELVTVRNHGPLRSPPTTTPTNECNGAQDCGTCCEQKFPEGVALANGQLEGLTDCACDICQTECAETLCAPGGAPDPSQPGSRCESCINNAFTTCTIQSLRACEQNAQCRGLQTCLNTCGGSF